MTKSPIFSLFLYKDTILILQTVGKLPIQTRLNMDDNAMDQHFQEVDHVDDIPLNRTVLRSLARHSRLTASDLRFAYKTAEIYPEKKEWLSLAFRFFISTGALLSLSGVLFFFTYNWDGLHKFAKLGMVQGGILLLGGFILWKNPSVFIRQLCITALCVFVGAYLIVFGAIYQIGALLYDFFWGWTALITLWVIVADFVFLWLCYLLLVNITISLYLPWVDYGIMNSILIILNGGALIGGEFLLQKERQKLLNLWGMRVLGCAVLFLITMNITTQVFDYSSTTLLVISFLLYGIGIGATLFYYVQQVKDIVLTSAIGMSVLTFINVLVIRLFSDIDLTAIFFLLSFFNIVVTTLFVIKLRDLNRAWSTEKPMSYE